MSMLFLSVSFSSEMSRFGYGSIKVVEIAPSKKISLVSNVIQDENPDPTSMILLGLRYLIMQCDKIGIGVAVGLILEIIPQSLGFPRLKGHLGVKVNKLFQKLDLA